MERAPERADPTPYLPLGVGRGVVFITERKNHRAALTLTKGTREVRGMINSRREDCALTLRSPA